jgi:hypothetical protein
MATIPRVNSAGMAQPGRTPMPRVPVAPMAEAQAMEAAGSAGVQAGLQLQADDNRLQRQALAEAQQAQREEERRQAEVARAAARVRDAAALNLAADAYTDAGEELATSVREGRVSLPEAEQQWAERSKKLADDVTPQFSDDLSRETARLELQRQGLRIGNGLRKVGEQRQRQEVTAGMQGQLERLAREYATDPATAEAKAMQVLQALGPASSLNPEQLQRAGQQWREQAQFAVADAAVRAARLDPRAVGGARDTLARMEQLDPQRRVQLEDRLENAVLAHQQRAELAAQRAARQQEATMRRAEAEFKAGQALADQGILAPEAGERILQTMQGTPYAQAFRQLLDAQRQTGALAAQPVAALRQGLDQINARIAQNGISPEAVAQRDRVAKVLAGQESDIRNEGALRAAGKRGVIELDPPLTFAGGLETVLPALRERVAKADVVGGWTGRPESPLYPEEAEALGNLLQAADPRGFGQAARMLSELLPAQQLAAVARQMDSKDRPLALALMAGATNTTEGRTSAELIRRGVQAVRDKHEATKGNTAQAARDQIVDLVGDSLPGQLRDDVIESALLISHGKAAAGERISANGALQLALGGPLIEHNGRKVPVPAGVDAYTLADRLQTYPVADLERQAANGFIGFAGGRPLSVAEFAVALPGAQLEPVGRGRYAVRIGGALALGRDGQRVTVEIGR